MVYNNLFVAAVKVNGKILRETRENGIDSVFIPFGSEYSIFMKNLSCNKVSVKISIDGGDVLNGKSLLINPNSESSIERFVESLNTGNKFKFIEKTNGIRKYRGERLDDGLIRIEYDFEKKVTEYFNYYYDPYHHPYHYDQFTYKTWSSETRSGITVEGEQSNQSFSQTNSIITEGNPKVIVLKLVGEIENQKVEKPITTQTKTVCSTCGKSNNSNCNFCPKCGTALRIYK